MSRTSGEVSGPTTPTAALSSSTPAPLPLPDVLLLVGAAAALGKHFTALAAKGRERLNDADVYLSEGATVPIRDPRNRRRKLGTFYVTDPDPQVTVDDEEQLLAFGAADMPDATETVEGVDPERVDEVLDVLRAAGREELIVTDERLREATRKVLLKRAAAGELIPGTIVTDKAGTPTVRPSDDDPTEAYLELVDSGAIDPSRLALPAA